MNVLLIYFLKVIAIQAILYLIYNLVFHKSGRHAINRFYVILALLISLTIPFVTLPNFQTSETVVENDMAIWDELGDITEYSNTNIELIPIERSNQSDFTMEVIVLGISLISILFLIRLIYSHFQIIKLKKQSEEIIKNGYRIYCGEFESPFSYFNAVFVPNGLFSEPSFDTILQHELVHLRKKHSVDRLLMEVILSIFWFNPLLYLFRNRLIEIHEFQADEEVIALHKNPIAYQEILFQQIKTQKAIASANYFKLNTIKTRIKMMNKNQKLSTWYYLLILPVFALITFSFATKDRDEFIAPLKKDISDVFEYVKMPSDKYTPSIMPVKDSELVRLTSGFGKRIHPILKVERMHEGVDFSIPVGKDVIATANGTIKKVNKSETGFGNYLSIDHNGGHQTFYAQLSEINVKVGQQVKRGEVIALTGNSGSSTGPHLHYEVRDAQNNFLDPLDFINDFDFKKHAGSGNNEKMKLGKSNQKLKVVIDPGHGGKDDGIQSSIFSEKEIALKVAHRLAEKFSNSEEVEIILTRNKDGYITLEDRVNLTENADLFISLHIESHKDVNENMMLAIYNDQNENAEASQYFADLLSSEFYEINQKFKIGYNNGYYVLKNSKSPAILFNMGYISNPESANYLNSEEGIRQITQELTDAIRASK
ncbi:N-acetylmuramoyl-L-alanine amidase [Marivirga sp.]|uniref:N-acetylmuramoyl-L-alanine amidase n=1 Tax=Marivirga sp. TaxID=2018662 RepID=UPI003DA6EDB2